MVTRTHTSYESLSCGVRLIYRTERWRAQIFNVINCNRKVAIVDAVHLEARARIGEVRRESGVEGQRIRVPTIADDGREAAFDAGERLGAE